jgi:hypothetical protein
MLLFPRSITGGSNPNNDNRNTPNVGFLACSATRLSKEHSNLLYTRTLCEDRQKFFAHLRPRLFVKNVRTVACVVTAFEICISFHSLIFVAAILHCCRVVIFRSRFFLAVQTIRIVVTQSATVVSNYYNDQLKEDIAREERIQNGKITRKQADKEDEEWSEVRLRYGSRYCTFECVNADADLNARIGWSIDHR